MADTSFENASRCNLHALQLELESHEYKAYSTMRSFPGTFKLNAALAALLVATTLAGCGGSEASTSSVEASDAVSAAQATAVADSDAPSSNASASAPFSSMNGSSATTTPPVARTPVLNPGSSLVAEQDSGGNRAVTVSWLAPDDNTDGSALTDLAGFNVYYGTEATNLDHTVHVQGIGNLTYVIENLASGTWYFAVTAVGTDGVESAVPQPVEKTL